MNTRGIVNLLLFSVVPFVANGTASLPRPTEFPPVDRVVVANMGPGCNIRIKVPRSAVVSVGYGSSPGGGLTLQVDNLRHFAGAWGMGLNCIPVASAEVSEGWAVPDAGAKGWAINPEIPGTVGLIHIKALTTRRLNMSRGNGWLVRVDDTTGDEKNRRRMLDFCLLMITKALCGRSEAGYLEDIKRNRKGDMTPHVVKILESIEFLDDAPP